MKTILTIAILFLSTSSFAVDFTSCGPSIQKQVQEVAMMIDDLEDTEKYSEALIDILTHFLTGMVEAAPACQHLDGVADFYRTAFKDLK